MRILAALTQMYGFAKWEKVRSTHRPPSQPQPPPHSYRQTPGGTYFFLVLAVGFARFPAVGLAGLVLAVGGASLSAVVFADSVFYCPLLFFTI